jgi:hypothetical protein
MADEYEALYARMLGLADEDPTVGGDDRIVEMRREVSTAS